MGSLGTEHARRLSISAALATAVLGGTLASASIVTAATPRLVKGHGDKGAYFFTAGKEGATFAYPSGDRLRLEAGATVRLFRRETLLNLGRRGGTHVHTVLVKGGVVHAVAAHDDGKSALLVKGPARMGAIVMNGEAVLAAHPKAVDVANISGDVRALHGGRWKPLGKGMVRVHRRGAKDLTREIPDAPHFQSMRRVWVASKGGVRFRGLHWRPVAGAATYEVEVHEADGTIDERELVTRTKLPVTSESFQPGRYYVTARAVTATGIPGHRSSKFPLQVVGTVLPAGAYTDARGVVYLGKGQKASFTFVDGLLMSYSGKGQYLPATGDIGLYRNARTTVHFRRPGSFDTSRVVLAPRPVYAEVHIGPKLAVWPRDTIQVSVELKDRLGRKPPAWVKMVPKVRMGVDPVKVAWKRQGRRWTGTIAPRENKGAVVIRVEVEDQHGVPLGRDFVEVIEAPARRRRRVSRR